MANKERIEDKISTTAKKRKKGKTKSCGLKKNTHVSAYAWVLVSLHSADKDKIITSSPFC